MTDTKGSGGAGELVFLTGASAGIGRALALRLARDGRRVVIASRRLESLQQIAEEHSGLADRLLPQTVDVTDGEGFKAAFTAAEAAHGPISTMILNAGDYDPMPLADFDPEVFRRLIEVNYLGAVNGIAAALPSMRRRGGGQILVTGSLSAYRGLPKAAPYGASKAAVVNMVEALKPEVDATGVSLRVVNPGFVRTRLTDKNDFRMPQLLTPEQAAGYVARELDGRHFEIFFPKRFGWTLKLLRILPYRLFFAATRRMAQ